MAHQSDWQKYSDALNRWQAEGGRASGPPPKEVRDYQRAQNLARDAELRAKGYGPSKLDQLNKQLDDSLKANAQREANRKTVEGAPKHARLSADIDSDCLESLTWKDGVATAT